MAFLALSGMAAADSLTLYTDSTTGQVFTAPGEGREEMGDFIDAKSVYEENQAQDSAIVKKETNDFKLGYVPVKSKTSMLQFSGQHYLGFVSKQNDVSDNENNFEMRRNYVQVKAFLFDDPKSYMRITVDETTGNGDNTLRLKYAYLFLNEVLPYTGVELGQVHRPWLDYEEHQSWWYRSVDKTFTESKESADLTNSADMGVNFKTKTPYFTSELGIFNGEGYHDADDGQGLSAEWRLTAAILGNGDVKRKQRGTTYWDASFWGQYNMDNAKNLTAADGSTDEGGDTYTILGFHTVYNTPRFLVSAQYNIADNDNTTGEEKYRLHHNGSGYSINGEYRFGEDYEYALLGRYDNWTAKDTINGEPEYEIVHALYGIAWEQNKNLTWVLNGKLYDPKDDVNYEGKSVEKFNSYMLTAEINW